MEEHVGWMMELSSSSFVSKTHNDNDYMQCDEEADFGGGSHEESLDYDMKSLNLMVVRDEYDHDDDEDDSMQSFDGINDDDDDYGREYIDCDSMTSSAFESLFDDHDNGDSVTDESEDAGTYSFPITTSASATDDIDDQYDNSTESYCGPNGDNMTEQEKQLMRIHGIQDLPTILQVLEDVAANKEITRLSLEDFEMGPIVASAIVNALYESSSSSNNDNPTTTTEITPSSFSSEMSRARGSSTVHRRQWEELELLFVSGMTDCLLAIIGVAFGLNVRRIDLRHNEDLDEVGDFSRSLLRIISTCLGQQCSTTRFLSMTEIVDWTTVDFSEISMFANALGANVHLQQLCLDDCGLQDEDIAEIAKALKQNETLQVLELPNNSCGPLGMKALQELLSASSGSKCQLKELDLSHQYNIPLVNHFFASRSSSSSSSDETFEMDKFLPSSMMSDRETDSTAGGEEEEAMWLFPLIKVLKSNQTLTRLGLVGNGLTDDDFFLLTSSLLHQNSTLKHLTVSRNLITDKGVEAFCRECHNVTRSLRSSYQDRQEYPRPGLQFITLGFNPIGRRGTQLLIDTVRESWDLSVRIDMERFPCLASELHNLSHLNVNDWRRRAAIYFDRVPLSMWPCILERANHNVPSKDSLFYAIQQGHMYFMGQRESENTI